MKYNDFKDIKLSNLGFGCMRFPTCDGKIDEAQVADMIEYAIDKGINYFDTAYPYMDGMSEIILCRELKKYPKEKWYLADKYPGHQIADTYYPEEIFEEQLKKCNVDYFDFYLLHNIYENSFKVYTDEKWHIPEYFIKQKESGRIKYFGCSFHGTPDLLEKFLDLYGSEMDFVQIQMNYLDWTLQDAKTKYQILTDRNIPCWVMEPVRGGKLSSISEKAMQQLQKTEPDWSCVEWAMRFLINLSNVKVVLSGMSSLEQMVENINTFSTEKEFATKHKKALLDIAETMKDSIPCTKCGYCMSSCPQKLRIPQLIAKYNDIRFDPSFLAAMEIEGFDDNEKPSACIKCGNCTRMCPQNIDIPKALSELNEKLKTIPSWAKMCKERAEIAKKIKFQSAK